jgi:hypothetical protein
VWGIRGAELSLWLTIKSVTVVEETLYGWFWLKIDGGEKIH